MTPLKDDRAPRIPCHRCHGSGLVELPNALAKTLERVRAAGPVTARGLFESGLTPSVTAGNNRLEKLAALGLIVRRRVEGERHQYAYEIVGGGT